MTTFPKMSLVHLNSFWAASKVFYCVVVVVRCFGNCTFPRHPLFGGHLGRPLGVSAWALPGRTGQIPVQSQQSSLWHWLVNCTSGHFWIYTHFLISVYTYFQHNWVVLFAQVGACAVATVWPRWLSLARSCPCSSASPSTVWIPRSIGARSSASTVLVSGNHLFLLTFQGDFIFFFMFVE